EKLARHLPRSVELCDLVGAGHVGLASALERCAETPDAVFEAYAMRRIRGEMLDELRRMDPLPRRQRERVRRLERAEQDGHLASSHSLPPSAIASRAGMSLEEYREAKLLRAAGRGAVHADVDAVLEPHADASWQLEEVLDERRRRRRVKAALALLPARLQRVLALHAQGHTLKDIGRQLGVSEARACQLRREALVILRRRAEQPSWP